MPGDVCTVDCSSSPCMTEQITLPETNASKTTFHDRLVIVLSCAIFAFHTYTALFGLLSATLQRATHFWLLASLLFVMFFPSGKEPRHAFRAAYGIACLAAVTGASLYLIHHWEDMVFRVTTPGATELFFGAALIFAVLEGARRTSGIFLPLVATAFLVYAAVGPYLPGLLKHKGYSAGRIISYLYTTSSGVYGIPLGVSATYIILFVFFGAFLNACGAGKLFMECSMALTGRFPGGAAKTAIVASAFMGTMSGSSIANAVTTGTVTIPLMRKSGFDKDMACAVEAVSSTGGMIMPPVMGAAAFLMSEYLRVDYAVLIKASFLPALLFFISIYFTVHLYALKHHIGGSTSPETNVTKTFKETWHLTIPIFCLIYFLLRRYSPMCSVVWSLLILIAVSWLRKETRMTPARCMRAIVVGAKSAVTVTAACAASGIILGIIGLTGVGSTLSSAIFAQFTNFLPGALVISMAISLVLGMGMPATALYLVLATVVAPSLILLGVTPLAAHMFVFYFGIVSTITPPVALTAYAAAAVGGGDGVRVGFKAFLLGIAAYCIPYVLVYAPEMMLISSVPLALLRFSISIAAVLAFSVATVGFIKVQVSRPCRILAAVAGVLLITPNLTTDLAGFLCLLLVFAMHRIRAQRLKRQENSTPPIRSTKR